MYFNKKMKSQFAAAYVRGMCSIREASKQVGLDINQGEKLFSDPATQKLIAEKTEQFSRGGLDRLYIMVSQMAEVNLADYSEIIEDDNGIEVYAPIPMERLPMYMQAVIKERIHFHGNGKSNQELKLIGRDKIIELLLKIEALRMSPNAPTGSEEGSGVLKVTERGEKKAWAEKARKNQKKSKKHVKDK